MAALPIKLPPARTGRGPLTVTLFTGAATPVTASAVETPAGSAQYIATLPTLAANAHYTYDAVDSGGAWQASSDFDTDGGGTPITPAAATANTATLLARVGRAIAINPDGSIRTTPGNVTGLTAHFFGDSHTTGFGLADVTQRYSTVLCTAQGWTENNQAVISTTIGDNNIVSAIPATTIGATDVSCWLAGYNDAATFGEDAPTLDNNREIVRSMAALLAMPTANVVKYTDSSIVYSSGWTHFEGVENFKYSSTVGATVTLTLTGTAIVVGMIRGGTGSGNASISVDGGAPITYSCLFSGNPSRVNGNAATPGAVVIPGLSAGPHTVVITVASGSVYFAYAYAVNGLPGPKACIGGCLSFHPTRYVGGSNPTLATYRAVELYTQMFDDVALELQAAGLDVSHATIRADVLTQMQSDDTHYTTPAHQRFARQFNGSLYPSIDGLSAVVAPKLLAAINSDPTQAAARAAASSAASYGQQAATAAGLIKVKTDALGTNAADSPRVQQIASDAAAGASGGDVNVTVTPLVATVSRTIYGTDALTVAQHSAPALAWTVVDATGAPVGLSGKQIRFVATDDGTPDLSGLFAYDSSAGQINVGGAGSNVVTVQFNATDTGTARTIMGWLWDITDSSVLRKVRLTIEQALKQLPS